METFAGTVLGFSYGLFLMIHYLLSILLILLADFQDSSRICRRRQLSRPEQQATIGVDDVVNVVAAEAIWVRHRTNNITSHPRLVLTGWWQCGYVVIDWWW